MNRARRRVVDDLPAPGPHAEYLLYQTLLGTWPLEALNDEAHASYRERIEEYMVKAAREAKRRTSWSNINEEYESALRHFIGLSLERREGNLFPPEVEDLARRTAPFGFLNSLAQTLCKLTAPGIPDIYQGNELWDWSLVDPDNRRPVDYSLRRSYLEEVKRMASGTAGEPPADTTHGAVTARLTILRRWLETLHDGRCKFFLTWTALQFRREHEALFREGSYIPLRVSGRHAGHVLAYARRLGDELAIVAVPRLCRRLTGERPGLPLGPDVWADTCIELPRKPSISALRNVLTEASLSMPEIDKTLSLPVADAFSDFPVLLAAT